MQCLHIPVHPVWAEWIINPNAQSFAHKADAYKTKPLQLAGVLFYTDCQKWNCNDNGPGYMRQEYVKQAFGELQRLAQQDG
jgi:hypothetical protein